MKTNWIKPIAALALMAVIIVMSFTSPASAASLCVGDGFQEAHACEDYAVHSRVALTQYYRHSDSSHRSSLRDWFSGSARSRIEANVRAWGGNADKVTSHITVSHISVSGSRATLKTIETWKVIKVVKGRSRTVVSFTDRARTVKMKKVAGHIFSKWVVTSQT